MRTRSSRRARAAILAALLALVVLAQRFWVEGRRPAPPAPPRDAGGAPAGRTPTAPPSAERAPDSAEAAFAARVCGVWVEAEGRVERVLADDERGNRHQRFILRLASGHSLLVAHNVDLAPRLPLAVGDKLRARGEFAWNPEGGVLHWTHRDPEGRRPGGWIERGGRRYE
jgi:hypothetical protein